jgi:chromosome segregation ATPase
MAESQLQKNTLRLGEFEKNIQELTSITNNVKEKVDGEVEEISGLKTDIINIKNDSDLKLSESNKLIIDKIKAKFQSELSDGEARIQENEQICEELSKEIQDLYIKIGELDGKANQKIITYRLKKREYEDLLHQFNLLKESFNDTSNENERLKKTLEQRNLKTKTLDTEIEDMKQVIAKLTDARIILNRYFSVHYENFTEEEKKLIAEIEGNTFPGYYNNNPVVPDLKVNTQEKIENPNKPNIDLVNISKKNNIGMRNTGKIMNAEEYEEYRGQLRSKAPPQISGVRQSQNKYNRSYVGPDDDYWYEKKK